MESEQGRIQDANLKLDTHVHSHTDAYGYIRHTHTNTQKLIEKQYQKDEYCDTQSK